MRENRNTSVASLLKEIMGLLSTLGKLLISYMEDIVMYLMNIAVGDDGLKLYDKGSEIEESRERGVYFVEEMEKDLGEEWNGGQTNVSITNSSNRINNKPIYDGMYSDEDR